MKDYKVIEGMKGHIDEVVYSIFDKGYRQGYEDGKNASYQQGIEDAWKCAGAVARIGSEELIGLKELKSLFEKIDTPYPSKAIFQVLADYTANEAAIKIRNYTAPQNTGMKIGDEVIYSHERCIVTYIDTVAGLCNVIDKEGYMHISVPTLDVKRTGQNYEAIVNALDRLNDDEM